MRNHPVGQLAFLVLGLGLLGLPLSANPVTVDLSSAVTGTLIVAPGASFAQTFQGQSVSGTGITGSPTNPLALLAAGTLNVAFWDPVISPAGNSILSGTNSNSPLSVLLSSTATSVSFTIGAGNGGTFTVDFFNSNGSLVHTLTQSAGSGNSYNIVNLSGFGAFNGFTIRDNNDPLGLRFMDFTYDAVPEPSAFLPMLGLAAWFVRRRWAA